MLIQRLRRWTHIEPKLTQYPVSEYFIILSQPLILCMTYPLVFRVVISVNTGNED